MVQVDFTISFGPEDAACDAALWLDESDDALDVGRPLPLVRVAEAALAASTFLPEATRHLFLMKFVAPLGSVWSVRVTTAVNELYAVTGEMSSRKEQLVGSITTPRRRVS